MGDSNIVASPNDKYGGSPFDHNNAKWYYDFLERTYLIEIQSQGVAILEAVIASDHAPIMLLTNEIEKRAKKDFKFESKWLLEEECPMIVKE
ncbi:hypothetical protein V6N12_006683 [Hibiscus sabdariffa]|uniref:Uncharacterized protein n=1 Tax=Hibiscus sabdariffa TaxID=183260 RepID=A0ABR2EZI6_9ROSI